MPQRPWILHPLSCRRGLALQEEHKQRKLELEQGHKQAVKLRELEMQEQDGKLERTLHELSELQEELQVSGCCEGGRRLGGGAGAVAGVRAAGARRGGAAGGGW
jgi:hypothetical protein